MKNSPKPGARDLGKSKYRTSEKPPKSTEFWDPKNHEASKKQNPPEEGPMILRWVSKKMGQFQTILLSWRLCCLLFGKGEEVSNFVEKQATSGLRFWGSGRLAWRMGFCPFFDAGNLGGFKPNRFLKQVKYLTSGKDWQTWYKPPYIVSHMNIPKKSHVCTWNQKYETSSAWDVLKIVIILRQWSKEKMIWRL